MHRLLSLAFRQVISQSYSYQTKASVSTNVARALVMSEHGFPENALKLREHPIPPEGSLKSDEVLINVLAAPINPSDINTIEGRYPLCPDLPATPGHEGVGVVLAVGDKVTRLKPGDRAVPIEHSQGTWRSHGVFKERNWTRIPHDLPIATAATMVINPPTALRLLEEFVNLKPGDTIVQTGGTSSVGRYITQLAKQRELNIINLIRDRPNREETEAELRDLGAAAVVTPQELKGLLKGWKHGSPRLALDCVGGDAAAEAAKSLQHGGTMVVYGSMSQQPLVLPPSLFIFKDITVRGFWLTGGFAKMKDGVKAKESLADRVCALFRQRVLRPTHVECVPMTDWKRAMELYRKKHRNAKVLLTNYAEDVCM